MNEASSLSALTADSSTSVVRVERVHRSTSALRQQLGQEVTVRSGVLVDHLGSRLSTSFFSRTRFSLVKTVAVREHGFLEEPADRETLDALFVALGEEIEIAEMLRHGVDADVIVFGLVTRTHATPEASGVPASEHDPLWWIAELDVREVLKGDVDDDELRVRFPSSRDVRWYRVPKPVKGDEAVFLLHRDGLEVGGASLALLHPEDVIEEHERFREARK